MSPREVMCRRSSDSLHISELIPSSSIRSPQSHVPSVCPTTYQTFWSTSRDIVLPDIDEFGVSSARKQARGQLERVWVVTARELG